MAAANPKGGNGKATELLPGDRRQVGLATVHCGLIVVQLGYGGGIVLQKVAVTTGVNPFVFAVYRDLVALAILIPAAYFLERKQRRPLTLPIVGLMLGSGLAGIFGAQFLQLVALSLASVSMGAALPVSVPVFTFLILILLGLEKIHWKTRVGQVKALAIVLSISGGAILCTVKGNPILGPAVPNGLTEHLVGGEMSIESLYFNLEIWQLGGIYFLLAALSCAIFIVLQAPALARYPAPISLTAFSYFFGASMLALTGLVTVKDTSSWAINQRSVLIPLVYAGLVSSAFNFTLQSWAVQKAGPLIVAFYLPLQSFAAIVLAYLFLGETIFLGRAVGASLIGIGLYAITWAKAKTQHNGTLLDGDMHCNLPTTAQATNQMNLHEPLLSFYGEAVRAMGPEIEAHMDCHVGRRIPADCHNPDGLSSLGEIAPIAHIFQPTEI